MPLRAPSRHETVTTFGNRAETFAIGDLRIAAISDPSLLPAVAAVARRFHPRTALARSA